MCWRVLFWFFSFFDSKKLFREQVSRCTEQNNPTTQTDSILANSSKNKHKLLNVQYINRNMITAKGYVDDKISGYEPKERFR